MKQKYLIILVAAVIILGALYFYISRNKAVAPETNNQITQQNPDANFKGDVPNDLQTPNPTTPTSVTIAVSPQTPGDSVTIDNVYLEKPGFVTIQEVDAKGKPGAVVGVSGLLGTGAKQDLEIKATLKPGAKYIAMLRLDNGDKKFDATKDVAVMKNNIDVMTMFDVSQ